MRAASRGTVKWNTDNHVARETQTLTDKARRKKRSGTFVPAFTIAFFRGIGLKPTATSHGSTPFCRVPRRGRLHIDQPLMHDTHHDDRDGQPLHYTTPQMYNCTFSVQMYIAVNGGGRVAE